MAFVEIGPSINEEIYVKGPRSYAGLKKIEISTAGFLFDPEQLFDIVHELNLERLPSDWIRIEAYPMTDRVLFGKLRNFAEKIGGNLPIPKTFGINRANDLLDKYPRANIGRVHLPFSFSFLESIDKVVFETDRSRQIRSIAWILFLGPDRIREAFKIAKQHKADINAHLDVARGIIKNDTLRRYSFPPNRVFVEDEDKPRSRTGDTVAKAARLAREASFGGLVAGIEHSLDRGNNPEDLLYHPDIIDQVAVLHIAKAGHGVLSVGDMESFFKAVANSHFQKPVSGTLDYDPLQLKKLTVREKFNLLRDTINWIEQLQIKEQGK